MYFCVLKYKLTLTVAYHVPCFHKVNFHTVLKCTVHTVHKYNVNVTIFNSIYVISTGVLFVCEGYTELAPLVTVFCTNVAVEMNSRWL
jgi:hypothetical protein